MNQKPKHWFRSIHEVNKELTEEPKTIEFLKMWTGETIIIESHNPYWSPGIFAGKGYMVDLLMYEGITHWRIPTEKNDQIS